jgi:transglutaminase-like putative cysteine protease
VKYRVVHRTEYLYGGTVTHCHNLAHLRPREVAGQRCLSHRLEIDPLPLERVEYNDFFGNPVSYFSIQQPHQRLTVNAVSELMMDDANGQAPLEDRTPWDEVRTRLSMSAEPALIESRQYVLDSPLVTVTADLARYAGPAFAPGRPLLEAVLDLMSRVHHEFSYDPGFSSVTTPLEEVFASRRGVCQDFAHLAIGCLRAMGLAARYVSGYLETLPPPGGEKLQGADASHAWFSVYLPDAGWLDFDPTNNQMPRGQHMTTAWGRDFSDVTPLKGVIFGSDPGHHLEVSVDVTPIDA